MGSYWGKYLCPNPPSSGIPVFPRCKFIKHVGWIPLRTSNSRQSERNTLDTKTVGLLKASGLKFNEDAYTLVQPTYEGCHNAMLRYDKPPVDLPLESTEYAKERLLMEFKPYAGTCPLASEEEMEWNRKASAGHYFKTVFGCKDTGEVLDSPFLMDQMREFARKPTFPTLWMASVKEELLPKEKVLQNIPRTFIIPDKRQHYLNQVLLQTQHKLFVALGSSLGSFMLCGSSMFYRGFTRIMDILSSYKYKFAGDASKWDSSPMMEHFVAFCIPVRECLFAPEGNTNRERAFSRHLFSKQLYDSYLDMVQSYVLLPTGEVILLPGGMNSGDKRTTDDNTLIHRGVTHAIEYMTKCTFHVEVEALWRLYSDDHVAATSCLQITDFEFRKGIYEKYGFLLKSADDFVSESQEGITLLGFKCHRSARHGCYVPLANVERLCCMLSRPKRRIDPIMQFARLNACRILTYFNPEGKIFKQLVIDFWNDGMQKIEVFEPGSPQQKEFESLCLPWTDEEVENLWLGYERKGCGLKSKLVEYDSNQDSESSPCRCSYEWLEEILEQ